MNVFEDLQRQISELKAAVNEKVSRHTLGTVAADESVLLEDGSTVWPATALVATVTGDRVLVLIETKRAVVIGKVVP